jgi:hypothetical protein
MQGLDFFKIFTERLNRSGIDYMVTGSIASIIYGEPRLTHDVDIVLELHVGNIQTLIELFPANEFYCPPKEVLHIEVARDTRGHFNLIHHESGFKADIYPTGKDDFHKWAICNKKSFDFYGFNVSVAPAEYVIIRKLEYYKEGHSNKHINDIKNMLSTSTVDIDMQFLLNKIAEYDLVSQWNEVDN